MRLPVVCEFRAAVGRDVHKPTKHTAKSRHKVPREQKTVMFRSQVRVTALCFQTEGVSFPSPLLSLPSGMIACQSHQLL